MNRIRRLAPSVVLACCLSTVAFAQGIAGKSVGAGNTNTQSTAKNNSASASHTTQGVVESVDVAGNSVTLNHEPVKSLNWPAMSMGFKVSDPKLLQKVKKGDKVRFTFVQSGRDYVITSIQ